MTPARAQHIRELCEQATPGPWRHADDISPRLVLYHFDEAAYAENKFNPIGQSYCDAAGQARKNMKFICESRSAIPDLLAECERMRVENERLRASGSASLSDSPGMTNNELTIKLQLSETRERQATEMCTWLTQENERLRNALKLADHLDAEVDELLDDSEEAVVQNAQLEHDVLVLKSALHVANAERSALAAEVERYRGVYVAAKTWCETVYIGKPHPRFPAYPGDELLHAVNAVKHDHTPKAGKP